MTIHEYTLLAILGSALVTLIPRVLPFLLVRKVELPEFLLRYLSYVPLAILTALFVQSLLQKEAGQFPSVKLLPFLASLPTILTAILTKSLIAIVIVGIISMAVLRLIL
ncbi:AzlD domain-containing protein [Listeria aquatica]|uniref:AzlD domain-containing protein n=1 Tax=Listeria aquatica TaxID=1494960 RepID=A0A841ZJJ0_9LIST|nr:AzlD domain-containing protein [Listeria aquatica]MBC1520849.1 AzlD domain-containing protein [Listeria aquatica]